ncbi:uncharacterized protein LOC100678096 [Nasonia vitripennis]|uniref:Uncharacterized protein n=1 Tax=Nasonia vitripennis TaxID=7425 RepID=A0A7M7M7V4_NASVI|nr:uncharacterized protein LOC100678096 [Nasonia vitripennis]
MKRHLFLSLIVACAFCAHIDASGESLGDKIVEKLKLFGIWYSSTASNHSKTDAELEAEQESLRYLHRNIVKNLNPLHGRCENPRAYICDSYWFEWTKPKEENLIRNPLKVRFLDIFQDVENLLSNPIANYGSKALSVEQRLYQDCMATEAHSVTLENQSIVELAFKHFIHNASLKSWQIIDKELAEMGFGYAFFDVSATANPDEPSQKIILLEPPKSAVAAFDSYESLEKVMNSLNANPEQRENFELAMHFFTALKRVALDKHDVVKITIPKWYEFYFGETNGRGSQSSEVFWFEMFQLTFNKYKMAEINKSHILVKNKQYFKLLEKHLRLFSNKQNRIVNILAVKWIIDNLKYISYDAWTSMHNQDKSSYCMHQTKLYATSYEALHAYKNRNSLDLLIETVKAMVIRIVRAIQAEIIVADLNKENEHLVQYVKDIATPLIDEHLNISLINSFYGDLHLTHNYHQDIVNYYKKITKALSDIKFEDRPRTRLPFSITDLGKPENRIVLRAFLSSRDLVRPTLHKEFHYGGFGAMISRFLFDLIKNKKYGVQESYADDYDWLFTHARFPKNTTQCFPGVSLKAEEADAYVSEILGLRIAYQAMIQHYFHNNESRKEPLGFGYSGDTIFILSYLKHHCYFSEKMTVDVLSNWEPYRSAFFNCPRQVKMSPCTFEIM